MTSFTAKTPTARSPFLWVGGRLFFDLLFNFGEPLEVEFADLQRFLVAVPPESILLARCLEGEDLRFVVRELADVQADVFGRFVPRDEVRWKVGGPRRHGR